MLNVNFEAMRKQINDILGRLEDNNISYGEAANELLNLHSVSGKPLKISFKDWYSSCVDGCCFDSGVNIFLNGEDLEEPQADDSENALKAVLEKLGYKVDINYR